MTASVDRLHRLIDDLLMFTTWETGQDRHFREATAVATLIEAGGARALAHARKTGVRVAVTVQDDRVGISPEALPRTFDRFYQVDGSSTREHGATGLGLALTRRLVERHGGRIWAESAGELRGSTFENVLPIGGPQE